MKYATLFLFVLTASFLRGQQRIPAVEELLSRMTVEEKIGQLNLLTPGGGAVTGAVVSTDVEAKIKAGQEYTINETRLGIPLFIGSDVIHGYKTTFPIPLGLASSWDMALYGAAEGECDYATVEAEVAILSLPSGIQLQTALSHSVTDGPFFQTMLQSAGPRASGAGTQVPAVRHHLPLLHYHY